MLQNQIYITKKVILKYNKKITYTYTLVYHLFYVDIVLQQGRYN